MYFVLMFAIEEASDGSGRTRDHIYTVIFKYLKINGLRKNMVPKYVPCCSEYLTYGPKYSSCGPKYFSCGPKYVPCVFHVVFPIRFK